MCRAVTCNQCGKPDWAGCGAHVEQVLGHVPKTERCHCRESKGAASGGGQPLADKVKSLFGLK